MRAVWLLALVLPLAGCLNEYEDPHALRIVGIDLQPARIHASDLVLNVTTGLDNRGGGATGDLKLVAKAYSDEKGFLLAEETRNVGSRPGDTTRDVSIQLQVPREGSVRVEVTVFEDELGQQSASVTAWNLHTLEPEVVDTGLRISDMDFLVRGVERFGNATRATIQADLYLSNEGSDVSENLRMQVKAREVATRLVADVQWVETGGVLTSTTVIRSVNLTVPDNYNYVFEILTWKGDVIVARSEGIVQLAPTFERPKDTQVTTSDPDVRDFIYGGAPMDTRFDESYLSDGAMEAGGAGGRFYYPPTSGTPAPRVPGFTAAALALGVVAAALALGRRRSR